MNTKKCSKCNTEKAIDSFAVYDGKPWCWCRQCQNDANRKWKLNNKEKARENNRLWRLNNPEKAISARKNWYLKNTARVRSYERNRRAADRNKWILIDRKKRLKQKYGITVEQYESMFREQGGACAICGGINLNGKRLFVDHNHETGAVRGLLCMNCNYLVGHGGDRKELLLRAAEYLDKHEFRVFGTIGNGGVK